MCLMDVTLVCVFMPCGPQTLPEEVHVPGTVGKPLQESLPGQTLQEGRPRPEPQGAISEPGPPQVPVQGQETSPVSYLRCCSDRNIPASEAVYG